VDWSVAASSGAESGRFRISAVGAVVGAEAWSESMRANAEGCGLGVVVAIEGHPNWADGLNASLSGSPVESSRCQLPDTGCAAVGGGTGGWAQGCGRVVCGAAGGMASEDLFWTRLVIVALFRKGYDGEERVSPRATFAGAARWSRRVWGLVVVRQPMQCNALRHRSGLYGDM
jgi:hypothetical protein